MIYGVYNIIIKKTRSNATSKSVDVIHIEKKVVQHNKLYYFIFKSFNKSVTVEICIIQYIYVYISSA